MKLSSLQLSPLLGWEQPGFALPQPHSQLCRGVLNSSKVKLNATYNSYLLSCKLCLCQSNLVE